MEVADEAILSALESGLLDMRVLKPAIERTIERLVTPAADHDSIRSELARVERELSHLTEAVARGGGDVATLVDAMRARDAQRLALIERQQAISKSITLDPRAALVDLQERLKGWRSLLRDNTTKARGLLKQLIVGRIVMFPDDERRVYRFEGKGTLLPLLSAP